MENLLIVSGDAHIGGTPDMYTEYLDPSTATRSPS